MWQLRHTDGNSQSSLRGGGTRDSWKREPGKMELEPDLGIRVSCDIRLQKSGVKLNSFLPPFHPPCLSYRSRLLPWGQVRSCMTEDLVTAKGRWSHSLGICKHLLSPHPLNTFLCLLCHRNIHYWKFVI